MHENVNEDKVKVKVKVKVKGESPPLAINARMFKRVMLSGNNHDNL